MLYIDMADGPQVSSVMMNMRKDNLVIGQIWLIPQSIHLYQVHLSEVIPKERGHTLDFLKEAMRVGFYTMDKMEKLIAIIPVNNTLAIKLTKACKFKKEGTLKKSYMQDGKLIDQVIYTFSRENL